MFIDDRMAALLETDEDLRRMVAGDWMRYRASLRCKS
jgi:maltose O-acetyltransferase